MKRIYVCVDSRNPYNSVYQQTMLLVERLESIYSIKIPLLDFKGLQLHLNKKDEILLFPYECFNFKLLVCPRINNVVFIYHNITPAQFFWKSEPHVAIRSIMGRIQLRLLKYRVKQWLAVSEYNKKELEDIGIKNVILCSNLIKPVRCSCEKTTEPSLLYVGRIAQNKRCLELLRIVKTISNKLNKQITLYIVGSGKKNTVYLKQFQQCVDENSNGNLKVKWMKGLTEEELSALYQHCWLYISLSKHEGFGLPVCESINNGTPAIYTKCGGQEMLLSDIGLSSDEQMPQRVVELLSDKTKLQALQKEQKELIKKITIPNYDCKIEEIFNELIL